MNLETLALLFCLFMVIPPAATALTRERETGSLESLFLTRLRVCDISGGKWLAILLPALTAILPAIIYTCIVGILSMLSEKYYSTPVYGYTSVLLTVDETLKYLLRIWPVIGMSLKAACAIAIGMFFSVFIRKSALAIGLTTLTCLILLVPWPQRPLMLEAQFYDFAYKLEYYILLLVLIVSCWLTILVDCFIYILQNRSMSHVARTIVFIGWLIMPVCLAIWFRDWIGDHWTPQTRTCIDSIVDLNNEIFAILLPSIIYIGLTLLCLYLAARRLATMRQPAK